jgi:enoyl-CoA hydratase
MLRQFDGTVLTLQFDRPDRLNAVRARDLNDMAEAVEAIPTGTRVIILAGDDRAFCSGADVASGPALAGAAAATIDAANRLVAAIVSCPVPVVACARGVVAGLGVSIAVACDLVLCNDDTYLLLAFTKIGLMPDGGSTALIAAAIGRARAMRMALLAERVPADEALRSGLVTHVWPAQAYDDRVAAIISTLAHGPLVAFARTKEAINSATLPGLPDALRRERDGQVALLAAGDYAEGAAAFAERRPPVFADTDLPHPSLIASS